MAAAAIPVGASLASSAAAPAVGAGLAGLTGAAASSIPAWLSSGLAGAAMGGIGSLIMGQNPLQGALLGGIGGGIGSQLGIGDSFGSLFGGGVNPDVGATAGALGQEASSAAAGGMTDLPWTPINETNSSFVGPMQVGSSAASNIIPSSNNSFWDSKLGKFVPYAGIGAAAMLADKFMAPEQVGPPMKKELKSGKVKPMDREYMDVDPLSYLTSGGNRLYFNDVNPGVQYYSNGGVVSPMQRMRSGIGNMTAQKMPMTRNAQMQPFPTSGGLQPRLMNALASGAKLPQRAMNMVASAYPNRFPKKFSNGGSSNASSMNIPVDHPGIGRRIKGVGNGMDDKIPAMLSDGEFVISAPVVSALGNGSNDAGARKLDGLQKKVLRGHYKGGKPKKSMGIGSYVH